MTKAQRADALLEAARRLQNRLISASDDDGVESVRWAVWVQPFMLGESYDDRTTIAASMALSEVAGLGYDIVDAETGEPAEKVAYFYKNRVGTILR